MAEKLGLNNIMGGLSGLGAMAESAYSTYNNVQGPESWTSKLRAHELSSSIGNLNSFDDWTNAYLSYRPMTSSMLDDEDFGFNKGQGIINTGKSMLSGISTGASIGGLYGAIGGGLLGLGAGLFGLNSAERKAENTRQYVKNMLSDINRYNNNTLLNGLYNIKQGQYDRLNYASFADGGQLHSHGADWNTGLNYVGNGGSHEENPYDGVPMGIAPDGLPNLVEEGEVVWNNDYVFSKRLKVPKAIRRKYKLGGPKQVSFADAAMILNKDAEERPNDPITIKGRNSMLAKLADVQEEKRVKVAAKEQAQQGMIGMIGMPQDQMAMEESMMPEEQPIGEMGQSMPMESMYAAKGGPIGHKFALGTPLYDPYFNFNWNNYWNEGLNPEELERFAQLAYKQQYGLPSFKLNSTKIEPTLTLRKGGLGKEYYDWLTKLSNQQYINLLGKIYPKKGDKYNKFLNDKVGLFNWANTGVIGDAYKGIRDAALQANPNAKKSPMPLLTSPGLYDDVHLEGSSPQLSNTEWYRNLPVVVGDRNVATNTIIPGQARNSTTDVVTNTGVDHTHPAKTLNTNSNYPWLANLRYAPAITTGIMSLTDLLGWTNKPDYSAADALLEASKGVRDVSFRPIGDYMAYNPFDRMFYLNQLNANASASRRALINQSAGNRGTAMAGILASDNNMINSIGQMARQAEEYNLAQRQKVADFNRATNMFNSEGFLKAAIANQGSSEVRAKYNALAADARQKALMYANNNRSINLTNFIDSLGAIGEDAINRYDRNRLATLWPGSQNYFWGAALGGPITKKSKRRIR